MRRWQWGGDESGSTSKKTDLADILDKPTLTPIKNSDLTAQISSDNYDKIVKHANDNIYDLISSIHDMQRSNFHYYLDQTEQQYEDKSLDLSKPIENVFKCTSGTSSATRENFEANGKAKTNTAMEFTAENCVVGGDTTVNGKMRFTITDHANKLTKSHFDISFSKDNETKKIVGDDNSKWDESTPDSHDDDIQTAAYDFKVSISKADNSKEEFTAKGKADFQGDFSGDDEVRPRSLNIHQGSVQSVQGYGSVELYTKSQLSYKQQAPEKTVESGKLIINANNGQVEVNIENGQAAVTATVGADKIADNVDKGDATKYLYTSN